MRAVEATIRLGGEERTIRFDFNTLAELEALGYDLLHGEVAAGPPVLRALVYAGLAAREMYVEGRQFRGPALTLYEVGALLSDPDTVESVTAAVTALVGAAQPDEEGRQAAEGGGDRVEGKGPHSSTSTPSPSVTSDSGQTSSGRSRRARTGRS